MSSEKPPSRTQILPSQLRLTPHTAYYSRFFLLRTPVTVNGQPAQIGCSSGGELTLSCRYPNLSLPLHSIQASLKKVVKTHGVSRVGDVCCEQVPLFPVSFSSEYTLRKFLLHRDTAQQQLESLFPQKLPTRVQLQLFLVSPNVVVKDAQMVEVTLENHSACMTLFKESEMFDYWSLFRAYRTGLNKTPVTIKDLVSELHDVISWFQLGIYLDISPSDLMKIREDHREKTDICKTEMLVTWLKQTTKASWSTVVRALVGMRMGALAQKVAVKYGVAVPSDVEKRELQHFPVVREKVSSVQSQLLDYAQQLHNKLEADDQRLVKVTCSLEQARKWKEGVTKKRICARREATSAHAKVKVLLQRRKEVVRQLQLRQKELSFLQQLQGQLREGERETHELREVLTHKDVEVRKLQEQLSELEKELGCAREEVQSLREKLQRVTEELADKSARVQELEKAKTELKEYLDRESRRVDMLLMQSSTSSKEALLKEVKDQLSAVEEESNVIARSEVEALKQTIADKDREIAELSEELQTLQSQLQEIGKCQLEEKEEDEVHRLMVEASDLRAKLVEAEGEKQEGERQLEATYQHMEHLQQLIADLGEKKCAAPQEERHSRDDNKGEEHIAAEPEKKFPFEKLFKVDKDQLQIFWRKNTSSRFTYSNSLSFHRIVEIREGQQFDKFPFEKVDGQSFSLMFEEESGRKYVHLRSLNLTCDHPDHYKEWIEGLRTLIPSMPQCTIFPYTQYRNVDPTLLWLKRLWASKSTDNEITQKDAISIIRKMNPHISPEDAKWATKEAHSHQFRPTFNYGAALHWDGFVLLFNILCERQEAQLFTTFRQYAKTHPNLGMTMDEFREFLVAECYWKRHQCTRSVIQELVSHHEYHNRGFKKLVAENKPLRYQQASNLFSFAGFLSFLRSKDNSPIHLIHETVYQDMTQPLSHYFINSSHKTYLKTDQLKGKSTIGTYIRALLQGSRCIQIDCWDDTFNAIGRGEPIIYHGYTLTTKLPFREVIQTIKEYAFNTSNYPVIISIENHCSSSQQSKMAKIFLAVMGDVLALENLVELEGRERLPSPQELQGKIILKGSFKKLMEYTQTLESESLPKDDQELIFEETEDDLKKLYVYCRAVSIKPWSWRRQRETTVSEMFSFGELSAIRHCRDSSKEMLACTERQLVWTYPKGERFDSSNYDPLHMWNCGVQMVALNYQFPDVWMHLNQGLFRLNGGCGYVLKPEVMRRHNTDGSTSFDPYMTEPNPEVPTVEFEIELLSGQRLCFWEKKCTQVYVDIQLYGINKDCGGIKPASHHNSFWPQWPEGAHKYQARILMPELCLVYFKVEVQLRKRQLYGQNCIPLISLKPGIKFIPLRTSGGELIPESGLFVRIKKGEETIRRSSFPLQHQASVEEDDDFVDLGEDVDVMDSISPSLMLRGQTKKEQSVSSSAQSSRPMSSPPILSEDEPKFELSQKLTQKQTVSVPPEQSPRMSNQATSLSS